ncbi:MAG: fucose isomerase, partial [Candidatus Fimadaptatus sp.]
MSNIPEVKLGIVAVSRDCFPIELSQRRRRAVVEAFRNAGGDIVEIETTVENEQDSARALEELKAKGVNALVMYLGNFGPETPETLVAQHFDGPVMF